MAIGMDIGRADEMMDPALNIYLREFWRLHYFINARFLPELRRYDTSGTARAKIERSELSTNRNWARFSNDVQLTSRPGTSGRRRLIFGLHLQTWCR